MANLDVSGATPYHVEQTLGGSCWLAALACALSEALKTPGKPSENDLKLVANRLGLNLEWADEESWEEMVAYLNKMYSGKASIQVADWGTIPDSWSVRDLISTTVNSCGSIIFSVRTNVGKHDIPILGIVADSANPLNSTLTACDPEESEPSQVTLGAYWADGIAYIVKVTPS